MANIQMLRNKIQSLGMTVSFVAKKSGILRETLYNRMNSGDFKASEIVALTTTLDLTKKERDDIFFNK